MKKFAHAGARPGPLAGSDQAARLDWVDALRGLAIIGVVFAHAGYAYRGCLARAFIELAATGRYGVDLFFVISGFVLYHVYRRLAACSEQPGRVFLFRRWARLAPVYYVGALVYGWFLPVSGVPVTASIRETFLNLLFLNGWVPSRANSVVPGGWSISAEAAFALFFVAVVPVLSSARRAFFACVFAWFAISQTLFLVRFGMVEVFGKNVFEYDFGFFVWPYMPTFMAGVWCWHVWSARQDAGRAQSPWVRGVCMFAALALLIGFSFEFWQWGDRTLLVGGACALAFYAWSAGPLPQGLVSPLAYLGRLSYGLYLIHFGMLDLTQSLVMELMPVTTPWLVLFAGTFLLTLAASLPLAWLSWKYLEHPVQVWAGKFGLRDSTPRREAPSISTP